MAYADSLSTTYTGRVVSVNEKGLKLEGHSDWFNRSKFAPAFDLPARGETVTVAVDSKGFLRSCAPASDADGQNGSGHAPAPYGVHKGSSGAHERDRTISRLAVLKAAAEFGASRQDLKSGDVLRIADSWLAWVNQPADDDLTDAF